MASTISTITGKPPWYGVVNNNVKSIHNTYRKINYNDSNKNNGIDRHFSYSPKWTVSIHGNSYKIEIDGSGYIRFYTETKSKMLSYSEATYTDDTSSSIYGSYTNYEANLFNIDINSFFYSYYYPQSNLYIKDTGSSLFLRQESKQGVSELIITNDGYIQIHSSFDAAYYGFRIQTKSVVPLLPEVYSSCTNCYLKKSCSKASDTRTTCYYNLEDIKYSYAYFLNNGDKINYVLLKPDSTSENGYYTMSTTEYISNTGLNTIPGELYVQGLQTYTLADYYDTDHDSSSDVNQNNIIRTIPLSANTETSKSGSLHVNVKTGSGTGAMFLKSSGFNYTDQNLKDGLINIKYNDTIYRNSYTRTNATNIEHVWFPYEMSYDCQKVFTQGTSESSSSYAYWNNSKTYVFSTRKRLKNLTLAFRFNYITDRTKNTVPNSSINSIRFYYNTGTSTLDNLSTSNCEYIDFTLPSPYYNMIIKTFTINNYVKQFVMVPIITKSTLSNNDLMNLYIDWITWEDYTASTNSFTYSE